MSARFGITKYKGCLYRIVKAPYETEERLQDRGWFVATNGNIIQKDDDMDVLVSKSHMWCNQKYFNMKYVEADHE